MFLSIQSINRHPRPTLVIRHVLYLLELLYFLHSGTLCPEHVEDFTVIVYFKDFCFVLCFSKLVTEDPRFGRNIGSREVRYYLQKKFLLQACGWRRFWTRSLRRSVGFQYPLLSWFWRAYSCYHSLCRLLSATAYSAAEVPVTL